MAGIYIHIPFCKQKCNYCNFFSLATTKFRDAFFHSLLTEIELTRDYLGDEPVETIYFGGGTPSLLSVEQLDEILGKVQGSRFKVQETRDEKQTASCQPQEITLEMNPDDVTPEYLDALTHSAINRISLGVQSFFDEDLNYLTRSHDARQALMAVEMILDAGYQIPDAGCRTRDEGRRTKDEGRGTRDEGRRTRDEGRRTKDEGRKTKDEERNSKLETRNSKLETISIDLIYGIPTLTNEHWRENLQRVIDFGIPHLSAYALTVEPKTPLAWQINKGAGRRAQGAVGSWQLAVGRKHSPRHQGTTAPQHHGTTAPSHKNPGSGIRDPISDDQAAEQFEILMDIMEKAGYVQYEISNFCLPGFESRHNSNYWKGVPYLGLGPSAHSYNGTSRRWNISNLTSYIRDLGSGILPFEEELLTVAQEYNEYVMTSLRTIRGSDLREIGEQFGMEYVTYFRHQAIRHLASGHLTEQSGICTLTRNGKFLADGIAADLFVVE